MAIRGICGTGRAERGTGIPLMRKDLSLGRFFLGALACLAVSAPVGLSTQALAGDGSYQVAQTDVGMFIDSHGRRVYYDLRTRRIVGIAEAPNSGVRVLRPAPQARANRGAFPPPPPPPPSANVIPAPGRVEREPLTQPKRRSRDVIQELDDYINGRQANQPMEPRVIPAPGAEPDQNTAPETQQAAIPRTEPLLPEKPDLVARLQVLLDREGFSPGVIDGQMGGNVKKALSAAREAGALDIDPSDGEAINAALERSGGAAFKDYTITPGDVAGPYVHSIPVDYARKAEMDEMAFTSPLEMLAERFHMAEDYLASMNPGADFNRAGTTIRVANPGADEEGDVVRIEADKAAEQVRAYDAYGRLVAAYPATIGSTDTPSPSGTVKVDRIAFNPNYTYNPKINFVQGSNNKVLTIPPGPNGPVGSIWIALSKPTYGIHGTPQPDRIGKTNSHGCVRLTNWDANELAHMVKEGVTVQFLD